MFLHQKFPKSSFSLKLRLYNRALFWLFSQKEWFFPQNTPVYQALFWLFCPIIQFVFKQKKSQKVNFSSNCAYNTGHFIYFPPKKSDFFLKIPCISNTILTFVPKNPVCFYNKNSQKVNFSSNCAYNTGHFIGSFHDNLLVIFSKYKKQSWEFSS